MGQATSKGNEQSQRWNTIQICPCQDSNMAGSSDLWPNTLLLDHGGTSIWVNICWQWSWWQRNVYSKWSWPRHHNWTKPARERHTLWNAVYCLVGRLKKVEMVILGGGLNGHVRQESDGYEGVRGGFEFWIRNTEGERISEFGDAVKLVECGTQFKKNKAFYKTHQVDWLPELIK